MKNFLSSTPRKMGQDKLDQVAGQRHPDRRRTGACLLGRTQQGTPSPPTFPPMCGFYLYLSTAILFHSILSKSVWLTAAFLGRSVGELD